MQNLFSFLLQHGLTAIFLVILLEYACFPVSSEIVLPLSGALAASQGISFLLLLFVSTLAGLIGTGLCFTAGRFGGTRLLDWIVRRFPKTSKGIVSSRARFDSFGVYAVAFGRLIPLCRTYIAFIAGASGMRALPFFLSSTIGITVWNAVLTGIGYALGENWSLAAAYYVKYKEAIIPVLLIVILGLIFLRIYKKSRDSRSK